MVGQGIGRLLKGEKKHFYTTVKEGNCNFIGQQCNVFRLLHGGGGKRNFIFIPKEEGNGWRRIGEALGVYLQREKHLQKTIGAGDSAAKTLI